jgi:hypothetical protein
MGNPTVTPITEKFHALGFLVSEAPNHFSRDSAAITALALLAGTVLGALNTATAVAAALGTNTGNGTFGTITAGTATQGGDYTVEFDDATHFIVSDIGGSEIGHGTTGAAFSAGGLGFTITAGGTAFVPGDSFKVTVSVSAVKYGAFDPTATTGLQNAAAILGYDTDASAADKQATIFARHFQINASELVWGANVTTNGQKTAALAQLAAKGLIAR